jgi:UDP-GlcNAc:undecaprenyl-phosphate GlcNAc-1-phosphate transferase
MERLLVVAAVTLGSCGVSAALVPASRVLARRVGAVDQPGPRKVHRTPMPRLGGVAVFVSFTAVVALGYLALPALQQVDWLRGSLGEPLALLREAHRVQSKLALILAGGVVVFLVGALDDALQARFPVWAKAGGQVVAALLLVAADVRVSFLPLAWLNDLVTVVWVVGMTNAFNLLDNLDGVSAGVGSVAGAILLVNAWVLGEFFICLLLGAFLGALLGFLAFNFHPASVFLGDGGALFIGYAIASLTLLERYVSQASSHLFPILMPVLLLALPLIDTTAVVVIRLRERRPIYVGDSRHLAHRLLSLGFSPRATALFLYLATFCLGLGALLLPHATPAQSLVILVQATAFVALFLVLLFFERRKVPR